MAPTRLLLPAIVLGTVLSTLPATTSGSTGAAPAAPAARCPEAGRATVMMPDGIDGIDGFRVIAGAVSPGAAIDVTILAGERDRTLRVESEGASSLLLDAPMAARWIDVALEPVLEAPAAACVDRVELLRGGMVVGTAVIE